MGQRPAGYKPAVADDRTPYNGPLPVASPVPAGREPAVAGGRMTHDDLPHPFTTAKGRRRATFRDRPA